MRYALAAFFVFAAAGCAYADTINGAEFFQLVPGNVWTLKNEQYPDRITTIRVVDMGGALTMHFQKNHPDTYHGAEGTNNKLVWYVTVGKLWIKAGNSFGSDAVGDAYPDDIRYDRTTGKEVWRIWLRSDERGLPACFLAPSRDFQVPSELTGHNSFFARNANGLEGWSQPGTWRVRWDLVESDVLRVRFDETYPDGTGVYEDWYLRRGFGLIGIRQYYDAARTQFRRGVASEILPTVAQ